MVHAICSFIAAVIFIALVGVAICYAISLFFCALFLLIVDKFDKHFKEWGDAEWK